MSVYLDVEHKSITAKDCKWGFITDDVPRKEFEKEFPDSTITDFKSGALGDSMKSWLNEKTVRIAEY